MLFFNGEIWRTDDAGKSWMLKGKLPSGKRLLQEKNYGQWHSAMRFTTSDNGIIVVYYEKPRGFVAFATMDGGKSWTEESLPAEALVFHGSIYLSRDRKYLSVTDLESNTVVVCRRK